MPLTQKEMRALPEKEQVYLIQFGQEMESLGFLLPKSLLILILLIKHMVRL
jgi:hypothetical protein